MRGCLFVATLHTQDDKAETVDEKVVRGANDGP